MRRTILIVATAALGLAVLTSTGCRRVRLEDDPGFRSERIASREAGRDIPLEGAKRLDARIDFGVGELRMDSQEASAVSTDFDYSRRSWTPEVSYEVSGDTGELRIAQPDADGGPVWPFGRIRNTWDLGLPEGVPTVLDVNLGVGESDLILGDLDLERLDVDMGVGDVTIDLSGAAKSMTAEIEAGVGELVLRVPEDVGVRVTGRDDGLGNYEADGMRTDGDAYVNDAYGTSPVTLDIVLRRGVGDVRVELVD